MKSFIKVAMIVLFATVTSTSAACQDAPGTWIGDGRCVTRECHCTLKNIEWVVDDFSGDGTTLGLTRYSQCGNFRILLSFRFSVKSILGNLKVLKLTLLPFLGL